MDQNNLTDLWTAVEAGEQAERSLSEVLDALNSARNFGIADMFGGKLIMTAMKHKRIDDAYKLLGKAKTDLRRFDSLLGYKGGSQLDIESLDGFSASADYLFDNPITDVLIQKRINNMRRTVSDILEDVRGTVQDLRELIDELV
ncbi:MAG: hypothetical protein K6D03_11255 [Solobacterium sp.]|nr:hypothetical protein [Solobacterium sp.]